MKGSDPSSPQLHIYVGYKYSILKKKTMEKQTSTSVRTNSHSLKYQVFYIDIQFKQRAKKRLCLGKGEWNQSDHLQGLFVTGTVKL